jgi:hypothetical protein
MKSEVQKYFHGGRPLEKWWGRDFELYFFRCLLVLESFDNHWILIDNLSIISSFSTSRCIWKAASLYKLEHKDEEK